MALANADTVALSLNGQSLGEKPVDKFEMVEWFVPYAAGKLEAVGKKDGKKFRVASSKRPALPRHYASRRTARRWRAMAWMRCRHR